ncbi:hypothetical protein FRB99_008606 [Tulasnella sp. 403]|nr:hypothetical protein FRB99_008606 [Tulasnella sp. 403]
MGDVRRWAIHAIQEGKSDAAGTVYRVSEATSALSVSPDNAWFATISGRNGDVCIVQSSRPDPTHSEIAGQVSAYGFWRCVSLGPMSNKASGLAAGKLGGVRSTEVTVFKYASWDFPGAYLT